MFCVPQRILLFPVAALLAAALALPAQAQVGGGGKPPRETREKARVEREKQRERAAMERRAREKLENKRRQEIAKRERKLENKRTTPAQRRAEYARRAAEHQNYRPTPRAVQYARYLHHNQGKAHPNYSSQAYSNAPRPGYQRLPERGQYREYQMIQGSRWHDKGAERIVRDSRSGRTWYTRDHYRSFVEIR